MPELWPQEVFVRFLEYLLWACIGIGAVLFVCVGVSNFRDGG